MLLVRRRHDEMPEDMFGFKSRSEDLTESTSHGSLAGLM